VFIWYISLGFGIISEEKSGNPVTDLFALFTASRGKKHVGISTEA
jgi:hypothetical protein